MTPERTAVFISVLTAWVILTAPAGPFRLQDAAAGLIAAVAAAAVFGGISLCRGWKMFNPARLLTGVLCSPVLAYFMLLAGLEGLIKTASSELKLNPGFIELKTSLVCPAARALFCILISLASDSLSVDIYDDTVYVHLLDASSGPGYEKFISRAGLFEKIIGRVFE